MQCQYQYISILEVTHSKREEKTSNYRENIKELSIATVIDVNKTDADRCSSQRSIESVNAIYDVNAVGIVAEVGKSEIHDIAIKKVKTPSLLRRTTSLLTQRNLFHSKSAPANCEGSQTTNSIRKTESNESVEISIDDHRTSVLVLPDFEL